MRKPIRARFPGGSERTPAGSQAGARTVRQNRRDDELVDDGHDFPFGLKARLKGTVRHSGMAPPSTGTAVPALTQSTDFGEDQDANH